MRSGAILCCWLGLQLGVQAQAPPCLLGDTLRTPRQGHVQLAAAARQALSALPLQAQDITRVRLGTESTLRCYARTQRIVVCPGQQGDVQFTLQVRYDIEVHTTDTSVAYLVAPNVVYTDGRRLVHVETPEGRRLRPTDAVSAADRKAIQCAFEAAQPYYQRVALEMACALRQRLLAYVPAGAY